MKTIGSILLLMLFCVSARADGRDPNTHVNKSINRFVNYNTANTNVIVSSHPAVMLAVVNVNTVGTGSKLELWAGQVSTNTATKIASIDTTTKAGSPLIYELYLSSGLLATNQGTTPADVTISFFVP